MAKFDERERSLAAVADEQLPALAVARTAAEALEHVLDGASVEAVEGPPPPNYYVRSAILLLSVLGLRTARALFTLVAAGYEPESHGLKRRLSEVHARAQAVVADESGQHARAWLEGKPVSTPRKVAGKFGSLELFDIYSASEHADARGVHWWLMAPNPGSGPETHGLIVPPHRRPAFANPLLTEVAGECRDLAHALATSRGGFIRGLAELDRLIEDAIARYLEGPPNGGDGEVPS